MRCPAGDLGNRSFRRHFTADAAIESTTGLFELPALHETAQRFACDTGIDKIARPQERCLVEKSKCALRLRERIPLFAR